MEKAYYDNVGTICIDITAGHTANGYCYKNQIAFDNYPDSICYIPEYGFEDLRRNIGAVYSNGHYFLTPEQVAKAIEDGTAYTRNSMRKLIYEQCADIISREGDGIDDTALFERFVDNMLEDAFLTVDWQYVSTFIDEIDPIEQWELFLEKELDDKRLTDKQRKELGYEIYN